MKLWKTYENIIWPLLIVWIISIFIGLGICFYLILQRNFRPTRKIDNNFDWSPWMHIHTRIFSFHMVYRLKKRHMQPTRGFCYAGSRICSDRYIAYQLQSQLHEYNRALDIPSAFYLYPATVPGWSDTEYQHSRKPWTLAVMLLTPWPVQKTTV
jgi:hypothetical protein